MTTKPSMKKIFKRVLHTNKENRPSQENARIKLQWSNTLENKEKGGIMLGKMPLTKKAHEKVSHPRAKFNGRLELPGWLGRMVQHRLWARRGFYRRGRLRKLAHVVVSGRGGAVLERGNFC
jgi:hypothetical protein